MMRLVLALFVACSLVGSPLRADPHVHGTLAPAALPGGSVYQLKLRLEPAAGPSLPLASFRGRPLVVTMFYSTCTTVCPMLALAMSRTAAALTSEERAGTSFLLVSFDAGRDTPAKLAEYQASHHLEAPTFVVAHASAGDVRALAAALGIRYRQLPDGSFSHASIITLLDRDGVPVTRTQVLAAEDEGFVASLREALKRP